MGDLLIRRIFRIDAVRGISGIHESDEPKRWGFIGLWRSCVAAAIRPIKSWGRQKRLRVFFSGNQCFLQMLLGNVFFAEVAGSVSCYGWRFFCNGRQYFCHGNGVFCDGNGVFNDGTWFAVRAVGGRGCGSPVASAAVFSVFCAWVEGVKLLVLVVVLLPLTDCRLLFIPSDIFKPPLLHLPPLLSLRILRRLPEQPPLMLPARPVSYYPLQYTGTSTERKTNTTTMTIPNQQKR